jgi:hypothetical protein
VRAEKRADGLLWALIVDVLERLPMNAVEAHGRMANLQDSVMIVNDIRFRLVKTTVLRGKSGGPITLADFRVGMSVDAFGTLQANARIFAGRIEIEDDRFVDREIEFTGTVEGVFARAAAGFASRQWRHIRSRGANRVARFQR